SGGRAEGWLFVAIDAPAGRHRVGAVLATDPAATTAPLLLIPCAPSDDVDLVAAGRTIQDVLLALHAQGFASAWTRATSGQRAAIRDAAQLPGGPVPLGVIAAGPTPEGEASPPRPPDLGSRLRWR
nr:nitroreductase family protein [Actinomycetota bacterium]